MRTSSRLSDNFGNAQTLYVTVPKINLGHAKLEQALLIIEHTRGNRMHYLLFYEVGEDYLSRRAALRSAHLEKAWRASARGELILGGALANPVDGAVLLFEGESARVAEEFAAADPYVTGGLVKRWYVREWTTVAGQGAANPVRPGAESS